MGYIAYMMDEVKATMPKFTADFVESRFGPGALAKAIASLEPEERDVLSRPLPSVSWIPDRVFVNLVHAVEQKLGRGDYALAFELGLYLAQKSLPKFYHVFVKIGSLGATFRGAPLFWGQVHSGGKLEVVSHDKHHSITRLTDFYPPRFGHRAFCYCLAGYFRGVLEFAGLKNVRVTESKCAVLDDPYCEFLGDWD